MAETSEQIKRHIANLTEFETKFGEFVAVLNHEVVAGEKQWSKEELARRKRKISALAAKADRAMKASGVGQLAIYNPPAIGGGLKSGDLPSQVFDSYSSATTTTALHSSARSWSEFPLSLLAWR